MAVLDHLLGEALQEYAQQDGAPCHVQVLSALGRLERLHRLFGVPWSGLRGPPSVAAGHDRFDALADELLEDGLRRAGVAESDLAAASRIAAFVVEGMLTHLLDGEARTAVSDLLAIVGAG